MEPKRAKCESVCLFESLFVCEFMIHRAACAAKNITTCSNGLASEERANRF